MMDWSKDDDDIKYTMINEDVENMFHAMIKIRSECLDKGKIQSLRFVWWGRWRECIG